MDDSTGVNPNVTLTGIKMEKGIIYQSSSKMGEEETGIAISSYTLYFLVVFTRTMALSLFSNIPFLLRLMTFENLFFRNRNATTVDADTEELDAHQKVELQFSQSSQLEALSSTPNQSSINVQALVLEAYQNIGKLRPWFSINTCRWTSMLFQKKNPETLKEQ